MDIHGQEPAMVYADYVCNNCDTPAAQKISGMAGHTADFHPCPYCDTALIDINKLETYYPESKNLSIDLTSTSLNDFILDLKQKDDYHLLRQAFFSRDGTIPHQNSILKDHGIRWSVLNLLGDWFPSTKTTLDFMHNIFLGLIAHFFTKVLFAAHMFPHAGGANSSQQHFEDLINNVRWPSHITRLPKNVCPLR
jgi:hypothetical protein